MLHYKRSDRLGDLIQREISDILRRQIKDPRIGFCTVIRVDVSDDLRYAKVRVSIMGTENQKKDALAGLKSATNFIKREIGGRIKLKHVPELVFILDHSVDYSLHIDKLIKEENKKDKARDSKSDAKT